MWLSPNPSFSTGAFETSIIGILMSIEPAKTRKLFADRAKVRAEGWKGLRLTAVERDRRLAKLRTDLRTARAQIEVRRREIEAQTNDVMPRVGDDPGVWLLPDAALAELAGASSARAK